MKNLKDIQKKTDAELSGLLSEKREELRTFRFGIAGSRTRNVKAGRQLRREIAALLTETNRRLREGQAAEAQE
jgi:ribosomal protein L29